MVANSMLLDAFNTLLQARLTIGLEIGQAKIIFSELVVIGIG